MPFCFLFCHQFDFVTSLILISILKMEVLTCSWRFETIHPDSFPCSFYIYIYIYIYTYIYVYIYITLYIYYIYYIYYIIYIIYIYIYVYIISSLYLLVENKNNILDSLHSSVDMIWYTEFGLCTYGSSYALLHIPHKCFAISLHSY